MSDLHPPSPPPRPTPNPMSARNSPPSPSTTLGGMPSGRAVMKKRPRQARPTPHERPTEARAVSTYQRRSVPARVPISTILPGSVAGLVRLQAHCQGRPAALAVHMRA
eukprot:6887189-Prymnesium_polylepis.1